MLVVPLLLWAHGPLGFGLWQLAFELRYVLGRVHGGLPGQGRRVPRHYTAADAWLPGCLAAWLPGCLASAGAEWCELKAIGQTIWLPRCSTAVVRYIYR